MQKQSRYDDDDFDYEDDYDDNQQGNRRYKKERKLDKKKSWERESVPDFDERR